MDAAALAELRQHLTSAERDLEQCATAAQHALNQHRWPDVASYAAQAARVAGMIDAYRVTLTTAGVTS